MLKRGQAFTLIELALVLVVVSLMVGFGTQAFQNNMHSECYAKTDAQLQEIQKALEEFQAVNGRYPKPAYMGYGTNNPKFGYEAQGTVTDPLDAAYGNDVPSGMSVNYGVIIGALPHVALNLPMEYASDCWGTTFIYAVTNKLTGANSYLSNSGTIFIESTPTVNITQNGSYAVVSTGMDRNGGTPLTSTDITAKNCNAGTLTYDMNNCRFNRTFYNSVRNMGNNTSHFDDLVVFGVKDTSVAVSNVYCWGLGNNGQNGNGSRTSVSKPTAVLGGVQFSKIYVDDGGYNRVFGLDAAGVPYGWGRNGGLLGTGTSEPDTPIPTLLAGGLTFTKIFPGNSNCGLTSTGAAYCWGDNDYGTIGDNTTVDKSSPTPVSGGLTFTKLSEHGSLHMCGITTTGRLYCWGQNNNGQLGDGTTTNRLVPTQVSGSFTDWTDVDTIQWTTCGLRNGGKLYCWGANSSYNLGIGSSDSSPHSSPILVSNGPYTSVGLGVWGGCATTSGIIPYCWGNNGGGPGTYTGISGYGQNANTVSTPTAVASSPTFSRFIHGGLSWLNCGITSAGAGYCWGNNTNGDSGIGSITGAPNYSQPTPSTAISGVTFSTAADMFSVYGCGIGTNGRMYCWGRGANGRLGDGTSSNRGTAAQVSGAYTFTSIGKVLNNVCAIATPGTGGGGGTCVTTNAIWGTAPNTCTGSVPTLASGESVTVKDEFGTYQGTTTATCASGTIGYSASSCTLASNCSLNSAWTTVNGGNSSLYHGYSLSGYSVASTNNSGCGNPSCSDYQISTACNSGTLNGSGGATTVYATCSDNNPIVPPCP